MPALQNTRLSGRQGFPLQERRGQYPLPRSDGGRTPHTSFGRVGFLAAQEMFGTGAASIALLLLVFDPNLLAHSAVLATAIGLSCFMFASIYAFYRYVEVPTTWRLVVVGLATGLALASKHSAILVFPMLLLVAICEVVRASSDAETGVAALPRAKRALGLAIALGATCDVRAE